MYAWIAFVAFAAFVGNNDTQSDEDYDEWMWELVDDPKFANVPGNKYYYLYDFDHHTD